MRGRPEAAWSATGTTDDLPHAEGLAVRRCRRQRMDAPRRASRAVAGPNDVWRIDFKGWLRTRDDTYCDPLMIASAHGHSLLACIIVPPQTATVGPTARQVFQRYGVSLTIRSDDRAPFAGQGAGGSSRPSADWIKAGVAMKRIAPGQPRRNGSHERMHRTLKAEAAAPPTATVDEQQARFDRFRQDCNATRPHEALGQKPPAAFHRLSLRLCPERLEQPWCDAKHTMRRVRAVDSIKWGADLVSRRRDAEGRAGGRRRDQRGRPDCPLRRLQPRVHRLEIGEASPLPCGPAGPRGSGTEPGHCHPSVRSIVSPIYPIARGTIR